MRPGVLFAALFFLAAAPAHTQTLEELKNDGKNTDDVLTYGMGYHQNRYSTLEQIGVDVRLDAGVSAR